MKVFSSLLWGSGAGVAAAGDLEHGGTAVTGDLGDKAAFSSKSVNLRGAGRAALGPGLRGATGSGHGSDKRGSEGTPRGHPQPTGGTPGRRLRPEAPAGHGPQRQLTPIEHLGRW